jgi:cell division protein FtsB
MVVVYLAVQAMSGRQGMLSLFSLKERQAALELTLATLRAENAALEARAHALAASTTKLAAAPSRS